MRNKKEYRIAWIGVGGIIFSALIAGLFNLFSDIRKESKVRGTPGVAVYDEAPKRVKGSLDKSVDPLLTPLRKKENLQDLANLNLNSGIDLELVQFVISRDCDFEIADVYSDEVIPTFTGTEKRDAAVAFFTNSSTEYLANKSYFNELKNCSKIELSHRHQRILPKFDITVLNKGKNTVVLSGIETLVADSGPVGGDEQQSDLPELLKQLTTYDIDLESTGKTLNPVTPLSIPPNKPVRFGVRFFRKKEKISSSNEDGEYEEVEWYYILRVRLQFDGQKSLTSRQFEIVF